MSDQPNNIVSLQESASPLRPVLERRANIKRRLEEIKIQRANVAEEERALYEEDRNLSTAEKALKKLLERK